MIFDIFAAMWLIGMAVAAGTSLAYCGHANKGPIETFIVIILFFFNDTATTEIYTLSLHDALPISLIMVSFTIGQFRQ